MVKYTISRYSPFIGLLDEKIKQKKVVQVSEIIKKHVLGIWGFLASKKTSI